MRRSPVRQCGAHSGREQLLLEFLHGVSICCLMMKERQKESGEMRSQQHGQAPQTEAERVKSAENGQKPKQKAEERTRMEKEDVSSCRSLKTTEKMVRSDTAIAPDGGWGWVIVIGCFLTTVCTRAVTRCVSIFFVEFQSYFSRDYSATAWIHSLLDSTTMLCAPVGGYIGNRLSSRFAIMMGGLLSSTGLLLSSLATSLEFLYLTLGVLTGFGFALSYAPAIAMVGSYFREKKALAYGIAMSGSGIGTFILAPAVQLLIEFFSWRGALLILSGLVSHLCVCGALMRPLESQRGRRKEMNTVQGKILDIQDPKPAGLKSSGSVGAQNALMSERKITKKAESILRNEKEGKESVETKQAHSDEEINHRCDFSENVKRSNDEKNEKSKCTESQTLVTDLVQSFFLTTNMNIVPDTQHGPYTNRTTPPKSKVVNTNVLKESKENMWSIRRTTVLREYSFLLIPDFLLMLVSFLFLAYGCSVPFVYLVPYSLSVGISPQQGALLMSILGVSGIIGTITFGWIADRKCLRPYRVLSYMLAVGSEGLTCLFLPMLSGFSLLVPFSLIYGYFDGAYVALIPVVTSDTVSSTQLTSALGVVYFLHAIPYLISPPIGGWLLDQTGSYTATFVLSGVSLICSVVILAAVRLIVYCTRRSSCLN
ncbi:hypothetical protein DNTS_001965 [Danionella cerebrum]|uniref:Major facilitator superfamily (MFS) profile domain-containing protein n=1 Tax=Danionella cerebrum TaxID=2873325 RepID=A0A553PIQ4_9TELE|nr:hypothetical protein DNTS_001965 [Danionella translucida]